MIQTVPPKQLMLATEGMELRADKPLSFGYSLAGNFVPNLGNVKLRHLPTMGGKTRQHDDYHIQVTKQVLVWMSEFYKQATSVPC